MSLSQEHLDAIRAAVDTALGQRPQVSTAELAVAAAAGGVGGSNLGQTQVELSGLNRVFPDLGPPRGVAA